MQVALRTTAYAASVVVTAPEPVPAPRICHNARDLAYEVDAAQRGCSCPPAAQRADASSRLAITVLG